MLERTLSQGGPQLSPSAARNRQTGHPRTPYPICLSSSVPKPWAREVNFHTHSGASQRRPALSRHLLSRQLGKPSQCVMVRRRGRRKACSSFRAAIRLVPIDRPPWLGRITITELAWCDHLSSANVIARHSCSIDYKDPHEPHSCMISSQTGYASDVCALLETRADIAGNSGKPSQKSKERSARITRAARSATQLRAQRVRAGLSTELTCRVGPVSFQNPSRRHCNAAAALIGGRCSLRRLPTLAPRSAGLLLCYHALRAPRQLRQDASSRLGVLDLSINPRPPTQKSPFLDSIQYHGSLSTLQAVYLRSESGPMRQ